MSEEIKYHVHLVSRPERESRIKTSVAASNQSQDFYEFRSKRTQLKVIRIDVGLPIYRMENFRTFIAQHEYIAKESKPPAFFQGSAENESVQAIQHEILAKLARTGQGDSIVPVIDVLRKQKQREPLLITHRGVVVNGNRRLAAMRELYAEDPVANEALAYVECMVLPEDATQDDVVDIEAALQAKPEVRLDYDWIGDAQLISKLISMNRTTKQIAERLDRREKEIKNSIQALAEADLYLKDWAKAEGQYSRVEDEQFFNDLPGLLQGKDAPLVEASRVIAWTLYDNRDQLNERLYAFNAAVGKRATDVLDRMADELGLSLEGQAEDSAEAEDFAVEMDEETATTSFKPLLDALRNPPQEAAIDALIDACRGVIESERNQKSGDAALKAIRTAHSKLSEVDLSKASAGTYQAIAKQLESISVKTSDLQAKLSQYQTG